MMGSIAGSLRRCGLARCAAAPDAGRMERGAALAELALVLPLLLVVMFGIVDFGRAYQAQVTLTNAAREGARVGTTGATTATICSRVYATAGVSPNPTCTVTYPNGNKSGESVRVQAQYQFKFITPAGSLISLLGGQKLSNTYTLTTVADMRVE